MDLKDLDLNLLLVLDALLEEGTLTRTAQRLRLSQPTVSASLAKLRGILGDELFVRENGRMQPTARALALQGAVASVLKTFVWRSFPKLALTPAARRALSLSASQ